MKFQSIKLLLLLLSFNCLAAENLSPSLQLNDFETSQFHSIKVDGGKITIVAGGADIWNGVDSFVFNSLLVTNDFDYRLRVQSVADADGTGFARSGLMVRDALNPAARQITAAVDAGNWFQTLYRTMPGGETTDNGTLTPAHRENSWVRLARSGGTFTTYAGSDGEHWEKLFQFDGVTAGDGKFTNQVLHLGIATSSHSARMTTTAVVRNFEPTPLSARDPVQAAENDPPTNAPSTFVQVVTGRPVFYQWRANGGSVFETTNSNPDAGIYSVQLAGMPAHTPLVFSAAAGGQGPVNYSATGLPDGLSLNPKTGLITGLLAKTGEHDFTVSARNSAGHAETKFQFLTGDQVALTPPMGWNSYDVFGDSVTEAEVLANARYMKKYLLAHGWNYVVVDFRWYDAVATYNDNDLTRERTGAKLFADEFGRMLPATNRFPSAIGGAGFKPLADQIHALGLKFGFHMMRGIPRQAVRAKTQIEGSSFTAVDAANPKSICGWCPDMFGVQDNAAGQAWYDSMFRLYAAWGLDFIKVDDLSVPYSAWEIEMIRKAIDKCGRPIVFSTSPGATEFRHADHVKTNATMWRISGDFWDEWKKLDHQFDLIAQWQGTGRPGHWPDADMIPFGHLGIRCWTNARERQTRFTKDEQRTLMSLWAIEPSPLMLGMNLPDNDAWTLSLLTNDEVIAVNQDPLGKPACRVSVPGASPEIWTRELASGSLAVGFFNRTGQPLKINYSWSELGFNAPPRVRDLWAQKDLAGQKVFIIELPPHGSVLLQADATVVAEPVAPVKFSPTWESLKQY